jgi:hypothetical protein
MQPPPGHGPSAQSVVRFDREFHRALFTFGRIPFHRWFTHRTHLSRGTIVLVSVCPEEYSHFRYHEGKSGVLHHNLDS